MLQEVQDSSSIDNIIKTSERDTKRHKHVNLAISTEVGQGPEHHVFCPSLPLKGTKLRLKQRITNSGCPSKILYTKRNA